MPEVTRQAAWASSQQGGPVWLIDFQPEAECFFRGDDPLFMVRQTPGLLAMDVTVPPLEEPIETLDVFRCMLSFSALSQAADDDLAEHFQYESDTVVRRPIEAIWMVQLSGDSIGDDFDQAVIEDLSHYWENRQLDQLSAGLNVQLELLNPGCREASVLRWLRILIADAPDDAVLFDGLLAVLKDPATALDEHGQIPWGEHLAFSAAMTSPASAPDTVSSREAEAAAPEPTTADPAPGADAPPLEPVDGAVASVLHDQLRLLDLCQDTDLRPGAFSAAQQVLTSVAAATVKQLPASVAEASDAEGLAKALRQWLGQGIAPSAATKQQPSVAQPTAPAESKPTESKQSPQPRPESGEGRPAAPLIRSFKVDQEQVEELGDLVGELVVAKNALPFLAQRAEQVFGERQLGREIREQFNVINRITRALQDAMMQVQMLPVSHVFDRFPRLVRDLSRKLDKPINLDVSGADTEAEKHVIETLADPLVHLMRNSIDHGVESRAVRAEAGKPETGQIALSARQENEWVVIEVRDDGAGIDPAKTRLKAYEKACWMNAG